MGPAGVGGLAPLAADTVAAAAGRGGLDLPAVAVAAFPSAAEAKVHCLDADWPRHSWGEPSTGADVGGAQSPVQIWGEPSPGADVPAQMWQG